MVPFHFESTFCFAIQSQILAASRVMYLRLSTLSAYWTKALLGSFNYYSCLRRISRDSDLIGMGSGLFTYFIKDHLVILWLKIHCSSVFLPPKPPSPLPSITTTSSILMRCKVVQQQISGVFRNPVRKSASIPVRHPV